MNEDLEVQFEVWENQLMELNEKFDQNTISFDAWLQDTELKFDQMEERISNELTGQPIQNTQQNPITHDKSSWFCEEDYYSEDEDRISPKFYESGLDTGLNEQQNPLRCSEVSICSTWDFQYPSASQSSHEESEGVVEFCLKFDKERSKPEAKIEDEKPKRAEEIIRHTEMKAYTIEFEYEDSDDEDWFEELNELIVEKKVQEFSLDKLETVSPMGEDGISTRFNESGKTTGAKIEPQTSSEKDTNAPREDEGARRTFTTEENYAPHFSEVRRGFDSRGFSYGEGYVELEVEEDENSGDEVGSNELETVYPMNVKVKFDSDDELQESVKEGVEWLDIDVNKKSENLKECEAKKKDIEGMTKEEFGKWLDNDLDGLETVSPIEDNLDFDFDKDMKFFEDLDRENLVKNGLKCLETVFPNKVIKDVVVNEVIEERDKPPDRDELYSQGIINFIDKFVAWLLCRKDESFGKVRVASSYARFHKKKCKNICIYFDYLRTLDIFVGTKEWNDAMVKIFEKVFVSNETCTFADDYFICLFVGEL